MRCPGRRRSRRRHEAPGQHDLDQDVVDEVAHAAPWVDGIDEVFAANTVAVNASPRVESAARVAYRGEDLREAYAHAHGRALLDTARA